MSNPWQQLAQLPPSQINELHQIVQFERERRRLRKSYLEFGKEAFPLVHGSQYVHGRHFDVLVRHLEAVARKDDPVGHISRLLVNLPPGTGKSYWVSQIFVPWIWTWWPECRVMYFSYNTTRGTKDSVYARELIRSKWYQDRFGKSFQISDSDDTKTYYKNTKGGWRLTSTPGALGTGEHMDILVCFPAGTKVATDKGQVAIEKVCSSPGEYRILTHTGQFRSIRKVFLSRSKDLVQVRHGRGSLIATGNHPVWVVGEGWRQACDIQSGQKVLILRERAVEETEGILLTRVLGGSQAVSQYVPMRNMRPDVLSTQGACQEIQKALLLQCLQASGDYWRGASLVRRRQAASCLLQGLQSRDYQGREVSANILFGQVPFCRHEKATEEKELPELSARVYDTIKTKGGLFESLCGRSSFEKDVGWQQFKLLPWSTSQSLSGHISPTAMADWFSGQLSLSELRGSSEGLPRQYGSPSHRFRQAQQFGTELDLPVQSVSWEMPWEEVEVCGPVDPVGNGEGRVVYNLDVDEDHTYFADSVLVHNCDDLTSADQIESWVMREGRRRWYFETVSTRGIGRRVSHIVNEQRLHVEDLSGHILNHMKRELAEYGAHDWHHICLPMWFEPDHPHRMIDRGYGGDWRTERNELVFPELLDEQACKTVARALGARGPWAVDAQLGQRPGRRDGQHFKCSKIHVIDRSELPVSFDGLVRFWDMAGTDGAGCYTAGPMVAKKGNKFFVLDMRRDRLAGDDVETLMENTAKLDRTMYKDGMGIDVRTRFEREPGSSGKKVAEMLEKKWRSLHIISVSPDADKVTRSGPLASIIRDGDFYVVSAEWTSALLDEMETFPNGEFKDQVDGLSGAVMELLEPTEAKSGGMAVAGQDADSPAAMKPWGPCRCECKRPAFGGDGYCCSECKRTTEAGEPVRHTPQCAHSFNEWWVKHH